MNQLTSDQMDIVLHASGLNRSNSPYREHYCCRADNSDLLALVASGHMSGPHRSKLLPESEAFFYLTAEGVALARQVKKGVTP